MTGIPHFDEPLWLLSKTDQKLAEIRDTLTPDRLAGFKAVLISLFDPAPGVDDTDGSKWDRTCDNCGKYCPDGTPYFVGQSKREVHGKQVFLTFGACADCIGIPA